MSLLLFATLAAESLNPTGKFLNKHAWGWYENEKTQTMPQSWFTESMRSLLMILLQNWQSDIMMMMMMIKWHHDDDDDDDNDDDDDDDGDDGDCDDDDGDGDGGGGGGGGGDDDCELYGSTYTWSLN